MCYKDYSKCLKCGSRKDISNIFDHYEYYSICYECLIEKLKKELGLKVEQQEGKNIFFTDEVGKGTQFYYEGLEDIKEFTKANNINEFLNNLDLKMDMRISCDDTMCFECGNISESFYIVYSDQEETYITVCEDCLYKLKDKDNIQLEQLPIIYTECSKLIGGSTYKPIFYKVIEP